MSSALPALLLRSQELESTMFARLGGDDYCAFDDSPRTQASISIALVSVEHGRALRLLIGETMPAAGTSLLRLQFESLVRSVWLTYAATDKDVRLLTETLSRKSEKQANEAPKLPHMLKDLPGKAPPAAIQSLQSFNTVIIKSLHSFVHAGIHPIRRTLDGYPASQLDQVVRTSNGLLTMAGMMLANLSDDEEVGESVQALQLEFADCLPILAQS